MLHPHLGTQLLAIILLIVLVVLAGRHLRSLRDPADALARELRDEIHRRMPVFSAETTRGTEAEFIRDRLPRRFPFALAIAALVLFLAADWWLNR
jgi:hypothetical protein